MKRRSGGVSTGLAIAIAVVLLVVGLAGGYYLGYSLKSTSSSSTIDLTETGSSLLYPLFKDYWFPNYTAPNVVLSAASTGSGTGQSSAELGLVNIGASDGYLSNASVTNLINFPVAISAQLIYYNLPAPLNGLHLNFNGTVLAMIYGGAITTWDNPLILSAQNSTVQADLKAMSSQTIYTVKRSDSSGDTFLFTSLCYMSWSGFPYPVSTSGLSGLTGTDVLTGDGNSGMVSTASGQVGSIAYIGISYEKSAASAGLQYAALGDNATLANGNYTATTGHYILPTAATISADANLGLTRLAFSTYGLAVSLILGGSYAGAIDLVHGGGGSNAAAGVLAYPIVNLEYALIKTVPGGSVVTAAALAATVAFMHWALSYGNYNSAAGASTWIQAVNFVPLTPEVIGYDITELASVQS
jgi:phosphate transport system substrate-binding protein